MVFVARPRRVSRVGVSSCAFHGVVQDERLTTHTLRIGQHVHSEREMTAQDHGRFDATAAAAIGALRAEGLPLSVGVLLNAEVFSHERRWAAPHRTV